MSSNNPTSFQNRADTNPWNLPKHEYMLLYFVARLTEGRTVRKVLRQAIDDLAAKHGLLIDAAAAMAKECPKCRYPLNRDTVSKWMRKHGYLMCLHCLRDLFDERQAFLAKIDQQTGRGPTPITKASGGR